MEMRGASFGKGFDDGERRHSLFGLGGGFRKLYVLTGVNFNADAEWQLGHSGQVLMVFLDAKSYSAFLSWLKRIF